MNIYEILEAVADLPGDYAECGVWRGFMAEKISKGMNGGKLWLFDSFKGHAAPGEFDDAAKHPEGRYSDTSMAEVLALVPKAIVIPGYIPETFGAINGERFRFVHIDLDHYLPTKAACEFFKSRMVPRGIIRFDDYKFDECPGATKAVDEVFGKENILQNDFRWEHNPRLEEPYHAE
jgi:O-methyltransferase